MVKVRDLKWLSDLVNKYSGLSCRRDVDLNICLNPSKDDLEMFSKQNQKRNQILKQGKYEYIYIYD